MSDFLRFPSDNRLATFPIARPNIWWYYKKASQLYWTPNEIKTAQDKIDYTSRLIADERHLVSYILAFFSSADGLIATNAAERFKKEIDMLEVGYFYNFQIMMEDIHAHTYSELIDVIIPDLAERNKLFDAISSMPVIAEMIDYIKATIDSAAPLAERLLRMACAEGIFFTGCFCAIYWLQNRGLMPGLGAANELIARDEALHTIFATELYRMLLTKLPTQRVYEIIDEAVAIAIKFTNEALPNDMKGMNNRLMATYIKCQADNLLYYIAVPALYRLTDQFYFMEKINMETRTNFFERRVTDYRQPDAGEEIDDDNF